ncbi:MAG: ABC transporter ATP-binding protein [Verrucomicrobiota bacterium]
MSDSVLKVTDLTKTFDQFTAVDQISFEIKKGEILGLLGVNGAGKTTAINMLLGLITPTSGRIDVFGKDLAHHRIELLNRSNFCSTYTSLPGNLYVWQNLRVFGTLYGVKNLKQRIDEVLTLLDMQHHKNSVSGHLSAGEATRLNLCKALLNQPELLLLDEPTASLDPDIADKVRGIIRQYRDDHQATILYTSHNMKDVEEVCDRVVFLHQGKIIYAGTPDQMVEHFEKENLEDVFIQIARSGDVIPA